MLVTVILPSGDTVAVQSEGDQIAPLKRRIEKMTEIPVACQELLYGGVPLERLPHGEDITIDLVVRVGRDYAIASAALPTVSGAETFRPARSIVSERDFEYFEHMSNRIRFSDNRGLERTRDISKANARAHARLAPYRSNAATRRGRLQALRGRLGANEVVVMSFNSAYASLFENWHGSCAENGIDIRHQTIVFPMDTEADSAATRLGYETFYDPESYGTYEQDEKVLFGDKQWVDCLFMKNAVMGDMLATGVDVLLQDVDIVWKRNPLPYLRNKANLECWDFMFHKAAFNANFQPLYYNSGFVYARSNEFSRLTSERILDNQRFSYVYQSQQAPLNIIMNTFRERGLRTCALDPLLFVNGHLIRPSEDDDTGDLHPQAYILHINWTDGLQEKLDRLRKIGFWYLDDRATPHNDSAEPEPRHTSISPHRHHAQCIVSNRLRCIFVALAKNASSTIRNAMEQRDDNLESRRCNEIPAHLWRDFTVFTFLRDPVDRALSAYYEVSRRLDDTTAEDLPFLRLPPGIARFDAFLDCVETRAWDVHVRAQTDLIGQHRIDYWGHVSRLATDLEELFELLGAALPGDLQHLQSRAAAGANPVHVLYPQDLPDEVIDRIRTVYRRDVELVDTMRPGARVSISEKKKGAATALPPWTNPVVRPPRS